MEYEYRKYVVSCWVWARETAIKDLPDLNGKYDENLVKILFNKVCQPYYYWKKSK